MADDFEPPRSSFDYTVACVCPMGVELAPVEGMLDEFHDAIPSIRDQNAYTFGRIGKHNIVIAVMPEIGNNAAASTVTQLMNDFPSIRIGFLVGIGGGVPGHADVRLGDVVVSRQTKTYGGVVQFDLGKKLVNGGFERTGQLDKPPPVLNASVQKLEAQHRRLGSKIPELIGEMFQRNPQMQEDYSYPHEIPDQLFKPDYLHQDSSDNCCDITCDVGQVVFRRPRSSHRPYIHYGTIGSANVVVKDAETRDELRKQYGVLCIEMEAAGFMHAFPCIVIRGICDYADSHKNKQWQPYAAATAAGYMKELLLVVPPQAVTRMNYAIDTIKEKVEDIEKLLKWIDAPKWAEDFEQAFTKRAEGTLGWVSEDLDLKRWQHQIRENDPDPFERILLFQAKPGFGKTLLAATVIEYLAKHSEGDTSSYQDGPDSVFYYFFDRRRGHSNSITDAVRAIAAQLLHNHKDMDLLRAQALRLKKESTHNQATATGKEILKVCSLLFVHLGTTFVILDGLDECVDNQEAFRALPVLLTQRSSGALLLSRPSLNIPIGVEHHLRISQLNSRDNSQDINHFLRQEFSKLVQAELIRPGLSLDDMTDNVSTRSNGMFLWAKLLIEYIQFPIWTLGERADIIFKLNRLEGLDAMYVAILQSLISRHPTRSHKTLMRLFQWVLKAQRPLATKEISTAISLPFDRAHSVDDEIPRFPQVLSELSGSLIEITQQGTLQFCHLSVRDFLLEALNDPNGESESIITSYFKDTDCVLASTCLSYLRYTLPAKPLAGSSQITPEILTVIHDYPFLAYSATSWSDHLVAALQRFRSPLTPSNSEIWKLLSNLILEIFNDSEKNAAWVEAAWLFGTYEITTIQDDACPDVKNVLIPAIPSLQTVLSKLQQLSEELLELEQSWSHVLKNEPNEIWEPSITMFKNSDFWPNTREAKLVQLAPLTESPEDCITLCSQIDDSGMQLGVVRLFSSNCWFEGEGEGEGEVTESSARYELWQMPMLTKICHVDISLSSSKMSELLGYTLIQETLRTRDDDERLQLRTINEDRKEHRKMTVSLPVAISYNARRAVVADTVVQIDLPRTNTNLNSENHGPLVRLQELDTAYHGKYECFRTDIDLKQWNYSKLTYLKFSPSNKYLALIRESTTTAMKEFFTYGQLWWLQIFIDHNSGVSSRPNYVTICSTTFFAVPEISILCPSRGIAFHPILPRLAFPQVVDGMPRTYLWDFEDPINTSWRSNLPLNPFPVHNPPILDPCFTEDGAYLSGTDAPLKYGESEGIYDGFCNPIIIRVPTKKSPRAGTGPLTIINLKEKWSNSQSSSATTLLDVMDRQKTTVQKTDCISFDKDNGGFAHVSQLKALTGTGAVVLRSLGQDQSSKDFVVTRLPEEVKKCVDVSLLRVPKNNLESNSSKSESQDFPQEVDLPILSRARHEIYTSETQATGNEVGVENQESASEDDPQQQQQQVYLVLNKAHKRYYTVEDVGPSTLPALIERSAKSIPTVIRTIPIAWNAAT